MEELIEELDHDGRVSQTGATTAHVAPDASGPRETVERCVKDGRDETAEKQARVRKAEGGSGDGHYELGPGERR